MKLRFFIVGLGSMGKRRIRNLHACGERDIVGFDIRPDRNEEAKSKYGIRVVSGFQDMSPEDFDVLIISTSPLAHGEYIRFALKNKKHFFVEHPVSDDGYKDIFEHPDSGAVQVPSCTFLYYTPVKMIKKMLDEGAIGQILAFQYHGGQYLPDWHPWEDYRQVYFSKKETGACREMLPFELIWLSWLVQSSVVEVSGLMSKISDLEMDADDILFANLKYENGVLGSFAFDVVSRKPFRTLRILGTDGVLHWERSDSVISVFNVRSGKTENIIVPKGHPETGYINEEEMYNDEIKAFLDAIREKKKYSHTFRDNYRLLHVLFALEKSNQIGMIKV